MTINELTSKVLHFAASNKDGYTLNIRTMQPIKTGFVVSYKDTQNSFTAIDVQYVISHALKHDGVIGGWYNSEDGRYYFDSNRVFNSTELVKAIDFGLENEQQAIFDLDNGKPIKLNTQIKKFSFSSFAEWFLNTSNEIVSHYKGDILIDSYKIIKLRNEYLFNRQRVDTQEFSLYWGLRENGTWIYHIGGDNSFSIKELQQGLGAKKIYLITFRYDISGNEKITVIEVNPNDI